jgi:hypothetical protein
MAPPGISPVGEAEFEMDDASDAHDVPIVPTELVGPPPEGVRGPFEEITEYSFDNDNDNQAGMTPIPLQSIEIPLPQDIVDSLPQVLPPMSASAASVATPPVAADRRSGDALVREVTIPLNLSIEDIREHRRLRLKITLDVNLLP